jgi:hypothetical protein
LESLKTLMNTYQKQNEVFEGVPRPGISSKDIR